MKSKFLLWVSIFTTAFFVGVGCSSSVLAQSAPDSDEYSIYKALLQQSFIGKGTKEIVVENQTAVDEFSNIQSLTYLTGSLSSLGCVDILSKPDNDAGKIDKTQIVLCQLIKPRKHSPEVFQFADAAFDQMTFLV